MGNILAFYIIIILSGVFHFLIRAMYENVIWKEIFVHTAITLFIGTVLYFIVYGINIYIK